MTKFKTSGVALFGVVATAVVVLVTMYSAGPRIDPSKVVSLDDLKPMALTCLEYRDSDRHGWPSARKEVADIRFLQDRDVHVAFQPGEDGKYLALVGLMDSLRIRTLYEEAQQSGIAVPQSPFTSPWKNESLADVRQCNCNFQP